MLGGRFARRSNGDGWKSLGDPFVNSVNQSPRWELLDQLGALKRRYNVESVAVIVDIDGSVSYYATPKMRPVFVNLAKDLFGGADSDLGSFPAVHWLLGGLFVAILPTVVSQNQWVPLFLCLVPLLCIAVVWYVMRALLVKRYMDETSAFDPLQSGKEVSETVNAVLEEVERTETTSSLASIMVAVVYQGKVRTYGSTRALQQLWEKYPVEKIVEKQTMEAYLQQQGITPQYIAEADFLYFSWAFSSGFFALLVLWLYIGSEKRALIAPTLVLFGASSVISILFFQRARQ